MAAAYEMGVVLQIYMQQHESPLRQHAAPIAVDASLLMESVYLDYEAGPSEFFDVELSY